jgi:hypothetical protein
MYLTEFNSKFNIIKDYILLEFKNNLELDKDQSNAIWNKFIGCINIIDYMLLIQSHPNTRFGEPMPKINQDKFTEMLVAANLIKDQVGNTEFADSCTFLFNSECKKYTFTFTEKVNYVLNMLYSNPLKHESFCVNNRNFIYNNINFFMSEVMNKDPTVFNIVLIED